MTDRNATWSEAGLVQMLKERPYQLFITDKYLACYIASCDRVIVYWGDYSRTSDEDCQAHIVRALNEYQASMN